MFGVGSLMLGVGILMVAVKSLMFGVGSSTISVVWEFFMLFTVDIVADMTMTSCFRPW
jgi:hypothetical protein